MLALALGIPACGGSAVAATSADASAASDVASDALDPPTDVSVATDLAPTDPSRLVSMSISFSHECAAFGDGHVRCRGYNHEGQLGIGSIDDRFHAATVVPDLRGARQVVDGGGYATLALLDDGSVRSWGSNANGLLGLAAAPDACDAGRCALRPALVVGAGDAISLAASSSHACVLQRDRVLVCWGSVFVASTGQMTPAIEDDRRDLRDLVIAGGEIAARRADGTLVPEHVHLLLGERVDPAWQIAPGVGPHLCATLPDRSARCWGWNLLGKLGDGSAGVGYDLTPRDPGIGPVRSIVRGLRHTCALRDDRTVWCWGGNDYGQAGVPVAASDACGLDGGGTFPCVLRPRRLQGIDQVETLYPGALRTCALRTDHSLWCWGASLQGQDAASPVPVRADW